MLATDTPLPYAWGREADPRGPPLEARLEPGRTLCDVSAVEGQPNSALAVQFRGGRPIDVIRADDARPSTGQGVGDPAVGVPIPARWQHNHLPRPQRWQQPFDNVALGMTLAINLPLFVDFVAPGCDDLGFQWKIAAGNPDAIKLQLQISLADEMTGILFRFDMADQIASTRESLVAKHGNAAKVAKNGISDIDSGGREVGFIQRAFE